MYHVLLFNDPVNTREYVSKILVEVFGHTKSKVWQGTWRLLACCLCAHACVLTACIAVFDRASACSCDGLRSPLPHLMHASIGMALTCT
jgi:hypothetical protein